MQVNITGDGKLQLTDDRMVYQPLSVEAVELLANSIPSAQTVVEQVPVATAMEAAVYAIVHTDGGTYASLVVQNSLIAMTCDSAIFNGLQYYLFGTVNLGISTFTYGPMTVTLTTGA